MKTLPKKIHELLTKPNHTLKISSKNLRLTKGKDKKKRFAYTLEDLLTEYHTIDNFLSEIAKKGFLEETVFTFRKMYGEGYHKLDEFTEDLTSYLEKSQDSTNNVIKTQEPMSTFLAGPETGNPNNQYPNAQFLGALVNSQRVDDYKTTLSKQEAELKDLRSENRLLKEDKHSLQRKLDTAEDKFELKLQKVEIEKTSFWESKGFEAITTGLAGLAPKLLPLLANGNGAIPAQMGGVENLTEAQREAIELIKNTEDSPISYAMYVLQNIDEELASFITNHSK